MFMSGLGKIDPNFRVDDSIKNLDLVYYDVRKADVDIYGLYNPREGELFVRMPQDVAAEVSSNTAELNVHPTGGRIRFRTDSRHVAVHVVYKTPYEVVPHITKAAGCGMDMYCYENGVQIYRGSLLPKGASGDRYTALGKFAEARKMRDVVLNMPMFHQVAELYIGLDTDAVLERGGTYRFKKPVVIYGSSIVHGGCADRPGNCYPAMVSRMLDCDYVNLGFSGSARGEQRMAEYIGTLDASVIILDYDYNAPTVEHLRKTHEPFYQTVRRLKPDTPIILMSMVKVPRHEAMRREIYARREAIQQTYQNALAAGDQNIYFIDGQNVFVTYGGNTCSVDGIHPNTLGFWAMANAVSNVLKPLLEKA